MEAIIIGIAKSAIRLATPYLYASIGETIGQLSGVLNLGVDGVMLMGAFSAFYTVLRTGNLWLGLLAAIVVGAIFGLLIAFINVTLKAEQGISGIGVYIFGLGLSSLLFSTMVGTVQTVSGFPPLSIPLLSNIPVVGEIFFQQNILVYGAYFFVFADRHKHEWSKYIPTTGINLGSGPRYVFEGGRIHPKFKISVPSDFIASSNWDNEDGP